MQNARDDMKIASLKTVASYVGRKAVRLILILSVASLSQMAHAQPDYATTVLSYNPVAFWQLNETDDPNSGNVQAYDSTASGRNGLYGTAAQNAYNGILGPQPPTYQGFPANQGALYCTAGDFNSVVSLPALNLSSTVVDTTIIMWINPASQPPTDAGLFFDRSGGASTCGLCFHNQREGLTELGYNWNDNSATWGWSSYLHPPIGVWSFVALVVETNRATIYLFYIDPGTGQPVLLSAVNSGVTHSAYNWNGGGSRFIGADPLSSARVFNGSIDGVAIYNSALTQDQILALFAAGVGVQGFAPMISAQPQSRYVTLGSRVQLRATVNGTSPLAYQWQLNGTNVNQLPNATNFVGANSNILTIPSATAAEAGTYRLIVTNLYGTVISSDAVLTIQAASLVGRWFTNDSLADISGYTPAGTHDGVPVPIGGGVYEFSTDVPAGKTGRSLWLYEGFSGIAIGNSSTLDAAYTNTFDERIHHSFTVGFYAKGWPGNWNPFVSKYGEAGQGWQLRQNGQNNQEACWTLRGTGGTVTLGEAAWGNPEDLCTVGLNLSSDTNVWRFYVGTFDAGTGERKLYVDGQLVAAEIGNNYYTLSPASFLCIGARDNGGNNFGNYFTGLIYDVRIYNYALTEAAIHAWYGVNAPSITVQPQSGSFFEGEPVQLNAFASGTPPLTYRWQLNGTNINLLPNSTNFTGINSNRLTILSITPNEVGVYRLIVSNAYGTAISSNAVISLAEKKLLGRWFTGAATLADVSGYQPPGTHDGYVVGSGNYTFMNDVPPGFTGQSLRILAADTGIAIDNSSTADAGYTNTFDDASHITVAFWAKGGLSGAWRPWVSKQGESLGWQLRNGGWVPDGTTIPCWTIRGGGWLGGNFVLGSGPTWARDACREDLHAAISGAGSGATYYYTDNNWHFYVGTFNAVTGVRKLYIDGVLRGHMTNNPPMNAAPNSRVVIGARDMGGGNYDAWTACQIYDLRIYNYDLSAEEIDAMMPDPVIFSQPPSPLNGYVGGQVTLAATVGRTEPITNQWQRNGVDLTDGVFGGAIISGAKSNVLTIANVTTNVQGVYRLIVKNSKGTFISSDITLTVLPTVPPPAGNLVGAWFTGAPTLADVSGYQPAGTHDGYKVGVGSYVFTNDVPPGKPAAQSLALLGSCAIAITNSSTLDAGYVNTFDETLSSMTVMFWAKGIPAGLWNPFVSKYGEAGQGWQLRRDGGTRPCWTLRGTGGTEDMSGSSPFPTDGLWHHYAGTFDPNTGIRSLYVDGVLVATQSGQGPYNLAQSSHVVIGGRDNGGNAFGNYFTGLIYDVRIYNVALTEAQINNAVVPEVPSFIGRPVLIGDKLILNWTFGTLLQATNVLGPWTPVTSTPPYTNIITTAPQMFFRLSNP